MTFCDVQNSAKSFYFCHEKEPSEEGSFSYVIMGGGFRRLLPTASHAGSARVSQCSCYLPLFLIVIVLDVLDLRPAASLTVSVTDTL